MLRSRRQAVAALPRTSPHFPASVSLVQARIDLHGGGHPRHQRDAVRYLVDLNANRNALRQPDPGEDRIDGGDALVVGLRVRDTDRTGDALDVAADDLRIPHQLDLGGIADTDRAEA